ncbi:MAG: ATP-grasp domain-containing protein [Sciscionella sp.]
MSATTLTFLRSIEVAQATPFLAYSIQQLRRRGVQSQMYYTDGECTPADFPGRATKIPPEVTATEICTILADHDRPALVSLSIPDENAVRDAFVKEQLEHRGGRVVCCNALMASTFANKWATKSVLTAHGISVPDAVPVDGDLLNGRGPNYVEYTSVLRTQVRKLGYPVLVKPLWDCLGNGIVYLANERDLNTYLTAPGPGNAIIERCITGTLCSVEVLSCDGRVYIQPIALKGPANGPPSFAFTQVRHTRALSTDPADQDLATRLTQLCNSGGIEGAIEFEFVYDGSDYICIEVNPRVSGSTGISIAASGVNTYYQLARMALRPWIPPTPADLPTCIALQFPVHHERPLPGLPPEVKLHRLNTFTVPGRGNFRSALISIPGTSPTHIRRWVDASTHTRAIDESTATQLEALLVVGGRPIESSRV